MLIQGSASLTWLALCDGRVIVMSCQSPWAGCELAAIPPPVDSGSEAAVVLEFALRGSFNRSTWSSEEYQQAARRRPESS